MKEIIALQEYTDKYISLYEGQIRNISDNLANSLIEKGIVAEHSSDEGGEGGSSNTGLLLEADVYETGSGSLLELYQEKSFESIVENINKKLIYLKLYDVSGKELQTLTFSNFNFERNEAYFIGIKPDGQHITTAMIGKTGTWYQQ